MRHPEQILSRHVRRRNAETTQNETPTPMDVHGAADVIEANPTNDDSDPTSGLRRSGRVGNSCRKPLTELEKSQRENLLAATVGSSKRSLYGKIVAETTQKISQAKVGSKRSVARVEIEKANENLGLKLPSEKHLVRLAHETPGKTPLPKGGAMLTTDEEMQVKRFVVELRARKFKVRPDMVLNFAEALIPLDDPRREKLGEHGFTKGIWPGLASRIGLHTGTGQRLDTTRAAWTTSANYYASHQALQDILLTEELFKLNPEYDEANPTAQPKMICLRPEALYSSDETDISLGQSLRKGKKDVCVFLHTLDDQNIATTKTNFMAIRKMWGRIYVESAHRVRWNKRFFGY